MFKLRTVPGSILRKKSKSIPQVDRKALKFIERLKKALIEAKEPPGVGLSAVQIGKLWRIFVCRKDIDSKPKVFINPEITWQSKKLTNGVPGRKNNLEGCLSVPSYYGLVKRAEKIKVRRQMANGKWRLEKFSGFLATVIQHEMDHLNGILFIDRVLEQGNKFYKLEKENGREVLQPITSL